MGRVHPSPNPLWGAPYTSYPLLCIYQVKYLYYKVTVENVAWESRNQAMNIIKTEVCFWYIILPLILKLLLH